MEKKVCKKCGNALAWDARICTKCRTPVFATPTKSQEKPVTGTAAKPPSPPVSQAPVHEPNSPAALAHGAPVSAAPANGPHSKAAPAEFTVYEAEDELESTGTTAWVIRLGLLFLILSFFLPLLTVSCSAFGETSKMGISMYDAIDRISGMMSGFAKMSGAKPSTGVYVRLYFLWLIPICAFISMFITMKLNKTTMPAILGLQFVPMVIGALIIRSTYSDIKPTAPKGLSDPMTDKMTEEIMKHIDISMGLGAYLYIIGFLLVLAFCIMGLSRLKQT